MNLRRIIIPLALAAFGVIGVQAHRANPHDLGQMQRVVLVLTWPIERVFAFLGQGLASARDGLGDWRHSAQRVEELERALNEVRARALRADWLEAENKELVELLTLQPQVRPPTVPARVLIRTPGGRARVLHIDRGRDMGVHVGAPVMGSLGLLGQVVDVGRKEAIVLAITDRRSSYSVRIGPELIPGMASGDGDGGLLVEGIPEQYGESLAEGMVLFASGEDGIVPAGIPIGRLTKVGDLASGLFLRVEAEPVQDTALRVVLVLP